MGKGCGFLYVVLGSIFLITNAFKDDSLLFCYQNTIIQINNTHQLLDGSSDPNLQQYRVSHPHAQLASSSFLARYNYLLFGDKGTRTIFLYQDEPQRRGVYAHVGVSEGIGEIAVDWLNLNVYWTDSIYSWIGQQAIPRDIAKVEYNDKQRVVVEKYLKKPLGLAVAPQQRYLFWTDCGEPPRLERSNLSGKERKTLIWTAIKTPVSIAVDPLTSKIFWIDFARATIETSDFEGQGRRILLQRIGYSLTSLTVFKNHILFTEAEDKDVHIVSKVTGVQSARKLDLDAVPTGLSVFSQSLQPFTTSPCDSFGCNHICVQTDVGPECRCDGGFKLGVDGKTCSESPSEAVWKSVMYSDGSSIRAFPVTTFNSHSYIDIEVTTLTTGNNINFLASDSKTNTIFFASGNQIKRKLIGGTETNVASATAEITGLLFDTLDRKVIWTLMEEGLIQTSTFNVNSKPADLYSALRSPGDITMDVKNRKLFWISSPHPSRIETGGVSGGQVTVLVGSNLAQPTQLTFDPRRNRLYWIEDGQIGSILADGSRRITQPLRPVPTNVGVLVFKDYLAWTATATMNTVNISVSVIQDDDTIKQPVTFTIPDITMVTDIAVYDTDDYIREGCFINNGGCEQLCLTDDIGNTCGCKFGFRLESDGKRCTSDVVGEDFSLVVDNVHNIIYQVTDNNIVHGVDVLPANMPSIVRYDLTRREIVWYDEIRHLIMRAHLNGNRERVVVGTEKFDVNDIDIDPSTSNIYYSIKPQTGGSGYIRVVTHDGLTSRTLVNTTGLPGPLLVFPKLGLLLWGEGNMVKQSDMSGSGVISLITTGLSSVSDLALDANGEMLYIADSTGDKIIRFELRTRTTKPIRQNTQEKPIALAVKGDNLYYLSSAGRNIKKINRDTGVELSHFSEVVEFGQLTSLYVYANDVTLGNTPCSSNNGGCSKLCLPMTSGRVCACPDGVAMVGKLFCENDKKCPLDIENGDFSNDCVPHPNNLCAFVCDVGYESKTSTRISCRSTGQWNVTLGSLCVEEKTPAPETDTPIALIVGVVAGVLVMLVIVVLIFICWKRGACRSRTSNPYLSPTTSRDPVIIVTKEEEVYDEIKPPLSEEERYTSFTRISPNPIRKQIAEHAEINNPSYGGYLSASKLLPVPHPRPPNNSRGESPVPDYLDLDTHSDTNSYLEMQAWPGPKRN